MYHKVPDNWNEENRGVVIPQNGIPQYSMPQNGMSQYSMPQNGMSQNGMPQNGFIADQFNSDVIRLKEGLISPQAAGIFNIIIPGLGTLMIGQTKKAILMFLLRAGLIIFPLAPLLLIILLLPLLIPTAISPIFAPVFPLAVLMFVIGIICVGIFIISVLTLGFISFLLLLVSIILNALAIGAYYYDAHIMAVELHTKGFIREGQFSHQYIMLPFAPVLSALGVNAFVENSETSNRTAFMTAENDPFKEEHEVVVQQQEPVV